MTLSDIATLTCGKVRHAEAEDLALCKDMIRVRYQQIFRAHLWKDSVVGYVFAVDPASADANTAALAALGMRLLPNSVERVLGMRSTGETMRTLKGRDYGLFWQFDYDRFRDTGQPAEFTALGAVAGWNATGETVTAASSSTADAGEEITVEYVDATTMERTTATVALTTTTVAIGNAREILSVQSPGLAGALTLVADGSTLVTLAPRARSARLRVPIQVLPIPTTAETYRVLAQRRPLEMTADDEAVDIRGLEGALIEYAEADMRSWAGQVGTAQAMKSRGDELLGALLGTEILATHANPRLVPEEGFGPYPEVEAGAVAQWAQS